MTLGTASLKSGTRPPPAGGHRSWPWLLAAGVAVAALLVVSWRLIPNWPAKLASASSPAMATPTVSILHENAPLEAALLAVDWQFDDPQGGRRFTYHHLHFEKNHLVRTRGTGETWHWWITGPRSVHVQMADDPATYDPRRGADLVFDSALRGFHGMSARGEARQTGGPIAGPVSPEPMNLFTATWHRGKLEYRTPRLDWTPPAPITPYPTSSRR